MDGTGVITLTEVLSLGGLAVDYKTSLVYWTEKQRLEILMCDIDGNNRRKLSIKPRDSSGMIAVLANIIYWLEGKTDGPSHALSRAVVGQDTPSQLLLNGTKFMDLEIIRGRSAHEDSIVNPCTNNPCSQICV